MGFIAIETSHIIAFSSGVGFFGLLFAIRNRLVDTKTKITVHHSYAHELISEGNKFLPGTQPIINVNVKNKGATQRFIEQPAVWVSRLIDGSNQIFYPAKINDPNKYPVKLESGAVFKRDLNLYDFESSIGCKLKDCDHVRFIIEDTLGGKYKSKKFKVKEMRSQIEIAKNFDRKRK